MSKVLKILGDGENGRLNYLNIKGRLNRTNTFWLSCLPSHCGQSVLRSQSSKLWATRRPGDGVASMSKGMRCFERHGSAPPPTWASLPSCGTTTSSDIVHELLSEAGHIGTPAAPGANSALINGVGEWNCSLATTSQQCKQVSSPPEFTVTAGQRIRFRLINSGVHAMFFYSVDEHMLNITEADSTPIYGPSDFRHIWLHNGQRYSVIVQTKKEDAGRSFHMRATMDSDCWAWIPNDIQDTAFGILRVVNEDTKPEKISKARPKTRGWPQEFPEECLDIDPRMMVPIVKRSVPTSVVGSGRFEAGFGFQFINNPQEHLTRNDAVKIAKALNLDWTRDRNLREKKKFLSESHRTSSRWGGNDLDSTEDTHDSQQESHSLNADSRKRQLNIRRQSPPPFGGRKNSTGVTRLAGPPPTPAGTIGKYFMNNISWATYPYQPVLHDLTPGGVGAINSSRVANVIVSSPNG
ncbi:sphingosine N-acyltransferase lac1 [Puccinia graminis f. sp. tritici]|uniref:Sphingosine N-acyltransferase lac1 n=1 Tax=Puccinia graminis f. sp. tritici TaxID=56615 RepID=A0A5B0RPH3_PUCGR|nr:sphingosine N-acyltransferase lac1 [Puccinia graminis f. sp. tritici]